MIYANHAASSWPKLDSVRSAINKTLQDPPSESERSESHGGPDIRDECRKVLASLFNAQDHNYVVLTPGATFALNLVLDGLLRNGGSVLTTATEHNSVLRPIYRLCLEANVSRIITPCDMNGKVHLDALLDNVDSMTSAVIVNHASNVTGTILNLIPIGELCRKRNIPFIVDASQSAGSTPLDMSEAKIDALIFAGHKSLGGPQGTGGVIFTDHPSFRPIIVGGTGIHSDLLEQPNTMPIRYEAGTANLPGIAGLKEGANFCISAGVRNIQKHLNELNERLWHGLIEINGIKLFGGPPEGRLPVQSLTIPGLENSDIAYILRESYEIICRSGLHCAPLIHNYLGTEKTGTVRLSFGYSNTLEDIDFTIDALKHIKKALRSK